MSSLDLTIDFSVPFDDDPWTFEYKTFDVLNDYLQPQSPTSPSAAALQLNELLPEIGILQLWDIVFRVAAQVPHDHPSQEKLIDLITALRDAPIEPNPFADLDQLNAELTDIFHQTSPDPPPAEQDQQEDDGPTLDNLDTMFATDDDPAAAAAAAAPSTDAAPAPAPPSPTTKPKADNTLHALLSNGHSHRNLHALAARLTRSHLDDRAPTEGVYALAHALEHTRPDPRSRAFAARGRALEWRVPVAADWVMIAGREVYGWVVVKGEQGGKERWEGWRRAFEAVAEGEVCGGEVREVARVAARRMAEIEGEVEKEAKKAGGGGGA
ncbi:uncharacterized protein BKCO1_3300043 [Diplodia corticola]|uniref:Uncharacterized protein n=1 Tax=Diplodia corticola TaxID=236234 RepID=A0A1J9QXG1_9PEZI|nr:uncharacterized protein BKCO1_3300043 [Diplodia corticola]OJD33080.1 hypothetical protein BKCO1_3300043 [Diplodia corticola]